MLRREDIRSVASIQDGILIDRQVAGVRFIDYCPGNGSRYELVFSYLNGLDVPGCSEDFVLVSLKKTPATWTSYPFKGYASYDHIMWKLNVSVVDALVLYELINHILGNKILEIERLLELGDEALQYI